MVIELQDVSRNAVVCYRGSGSFEVPADKNLKLKAGTEDIISEKVPTGKKWDVSVSIVISETDA